MPNYIIPFLYPLGTNKSAGTGWRKKRGTNLRRPFCSPQTLFLWQYLKGLPMLAQLTDIINLDLMHPNFRSPANQIEETLLSP